MAYKTLSLIDDEAHEQITYHLAERLTDTSDRLCRYVRDLCIVNFKGDARSSCLNTRLIEDCLRHIQRLDSFTWDGTYPIPIEILDVLQQRFPRATVCAKVALSQPSLLEISQLSRLDVSIPLADAFADRSMSLFQALKQAVFQLPNLRHLSIDTHFETGIENIEGAAYSRPQIPLELGDQLPPLESLQIRSISYAFDLEHCQLLLASMDCNKLRSLILGSPNPVNFFEVFVGRLCQLTELDISYASNRDDPRHLRLEACSKLLAGLDSLQKLSFRFDKLDLRSNFAQTLQEVHGPRLLSLSLQPGHIDTAGQELCGNVRRFLHKFVRLQLLDMAFADVASYHRCSDCQGYDYSIHVSSCQTSHKTAHLPLSGPYPILIHSASPVHQAHESFGSIELQRKGLDCTYQQARSLRNMQFVEWFCRSAKISGGVTQYTILAVGIRP